jgi:hypothetical protein
MEGRGKEKDVERFLAALSRTANKNCGKKKAGI